MRTATAISCLVAGSLAAGLVVSGAASAAPATSCGSRTTRTMTYSHMRVVNGTCEQGRAMVLQFRRALGVPGCMRQPSMNDIHITCGTSKGMFMHVVSFAHPEWRLSFKGRTVFMDVNAPAVD